MKLHYDENALDRNFEPRDKVLAVLLIPGKPLQARYHGPYTVDKKLSDINYIVNTPGRRKHRQLCHINMLKKYIDRDSSVISSVNLVNSVSHEQNQSDSEDMNFVKSDPSSSKIQNSDILKDLHQKLSHLDSDKRLELKQLILEYEHLFPDISSRTDKIYHDVDIIIFREKWEQHLQTIRTFFDRLSDAKLTVNLAKSEFCLANLTFLGLIVGQGQEKHVEAKVEAISDFPVPTGKRQLMRFLGMAGYYRKFSNNFSVIAEPLTNLLGKRVKYVWTDDCQKSFDKLNAILKSAPVLLAPSFDKEFKLAVDASDVGAGSVLL